VAAAGVTPEQALRVRAEADLLYPGPAVEAALDRMAGRIAEGLGGSDPLVLCVLSGAVVAVGKLLPRLDFPLTLDCLHATRYRDTTHGGELDWRVRPRVPLAGRTVLVVDDILDEGLTLAAILGYCRAQGAREVRTAVLVDKRRERQVEVTPDFVGLTVPNRYVFGYGMDYHGYWRNAPGIYAVKGL
jgi:hypoxanthine phosphoribosyltransferase